MNSTSRIKYGETCPEVAVVAGFAGNIDPSFEQRDAL